MISPQLWPPPGLPEGVRDLLREYSDVFVEEMSPEQCFILPPMNMDLIDSSLMFVCGHTWPSL